MNEFFEEEEEEYKSEYDNYLKDVIFVNESDNYKLFNPDYELLLKTEIIKKSFSGDFEYFFNVYRDISNVIPEKENSIEQKGKSVEINISKINNPTSEKDEWIHGKVIKILKNNDKNIYIVRTDNGEEHSLDDVNNIHLFKWKDCVGDCYKTCRNYIKNEIKSTAYMLRIITTSVLGNTEEYKICFSYDGGDSQNDFKITGNWHEDYTFFKMNIMKISKENNTDYKIIKINSGVNQKIKPLDMYLTIVNSKVNDIFQIYKKILEYDSLSKNINGDDSIKFTYEEMLEKYVNPFQKNHDDVEKIISLLNTFNALKKETNRDKQIYDELNYRYYISNYVLFEGNDSDFSRDKNRGIDERYEYDDSTKISNNITFNELNDDLKYFGIKNIDPSNQLGDDDYRNLIRNLVEKLREIQKKNDNLISKIIEYIVIEFKDFILPVEDNKNNNSKIIDDDLYFRNIYKKILLNSTKIKIFIGNDPPNPSTTISRVEYSENKNGRFILGAGPSASGKTYNSGLIIKMMKFIDETFPEFFITIDGGIYREKSVVYQIIVKAIKNKNQYPGLTNLMSTSFLHTIRGINSIFQANTTKKIINEYLLKQTKEYGLVISLYFPDTFAFCGIYSTLVEINCYSKIKKYIEITGDENWIGLMIYQHKTGGNGCPFKKEYKCVGCSESGKSREKKEGKKYSSSAWKMSYNNGLDTVKKAPNIRFVFHNGGKPGSTSIFEDLSNEKIPYDDNENIRNLFEDNKIIYINGELKNSPDCHRYLLTGCSETYIDDIKNVYDSLTKNTSVEEDKSNVEFTNFYNNKYIGIPKELMYDYMSNIQLLLDNNIFEFVNVDEINETDDEKGYNYYHIIIKQPLNKNDYDIIKNVIDNDNIKLFEIDNTSKKDAGDVTNIIPPPQTKPITTVESINSIETTNEPEQQSIFDVKLLQFYNNKYFGIPKNIIDLSQNIKNLLPNEISIDDSLATPDEKKYYYYHIMLDGKSNEEKQELVTILDNLIKDENINIKLYEPYEKNNVDEEILIEPSISAVEPVTELNEIEIEKDKKMINGIDVDDIETFIIPSELLSPVVVSHVNDVNVINNPDTSSYRWPSITSTILNIIRSAIRTLSFSKDNQNTEQNISNIGGDILHVDDNKAYGEKVKLVSINMRNPNTRHIVSDLVNSGQIFDMRGTFKPLPNKNNILNVVEKNNVDVVKEKPVFIPLQHSVIAKLKDYCRDKYIGVPKNLDDINDKNIIDNLESIGYIRKISDNEINEKGIIENEKNYDYYEIIVNDKIKEIIQRFYDDLQKLSILDNLIVYDSVNDTSLSTTPTNVVVPPSPVKKITIKSNIKSFMNVLKNAANISTSDFLNSLSNISKRVIIGNKTRKNKNGIHINYGPKCKTKKSFFGRIGNIFSGGSKKKHSKIHKTKKNIIANRK